MCALRSCSSFGIAAERNPFEPTEKPAKDIAAKAEAMGMKVWQKQSTYQSGQVSWICR